MKDDKTTPWLEKIGVRYFHHLSRNKRIARTDEIHILNERERQQLKSIEHWAVFRAGMAGAIAGTVVVLIALAADPIFVAHGEEPGLGEAWDYWLIVLLLGAVVTLVEIAYLYWDALNSVHKIACAAGIELFPKTDERTAVINSLVQAAFELPGTRQNDYVTSGAEISKGMLFLVTVLYKLKVTLTAFIAKALFKRMAGRLAARAWLEFLGIPIYFFWDAFVAKMVIREARIRAMGPSAAREIMDQLLADHPDLSPSGKQAAFLAIGATIARNTTLHPNLNYLLNELIARQGPPAKIDIGNSEKFLSILPQLTQKEQGFVMAILEVAAILDGRISRWEMALVYRAQAVCNHSHSMARCQKMRSAFRAGRHVQVVEQRPGRTD